jgi:hypothetical protein
MFHGSMVADRSHVPTPFLSLRALPIPSVVSRQWGDGRMCCRRRTCAAPNAPLRRHPLLAANIGMPHLPRRPVVTL